jgi:hypothetical protein
MFKKLLKNSSRVTEPSGDRVFSVKLIILSGSVELVVFMSVSVNKLQLMIKCSNAKKLLVIFIVYRSYTNLGYSFQE